MYEPESIDLRRASRAGVSTPNHPARRQRTAAIPACPPASPSTVYRLPSTAPRGFTLVELLVVIVVIGILAALAVPAVMGARNAARRAAILSDISQLDMKMQDYKDRFNAYPPDFTSFRNPNFPRRPDGVPIDIHRHMSSAFPRFVGSFSDIENFYDDTSNAWSNPDMNRVIRLDPAEAIVFWLGGLSLREGVDSNLLKGFSRNPVNLFEGSNQRQRISGLHEFDPERLVDCDEDGWWEYIPPGGGAVFNRCSTTPPYVYFQFRSYTTPPPGELSTKNVESFIYFPGYITEWGRCAPYREGATADPNATSPGEDYGKGWVNPQSFQIISAGLDEKYGSPNPGKRYFPSGESTGGSFGYHANELDNLTNFSTSTLEDARP